MWLCSNLVRMTRLVHIVYDVSTFIHIFHYLYRHGQPNPESLSTMRVQNRLCMSVKIVKNMYESAYIIHITQCVPIMSFYQKLLHNHPKWHKHSKYKPCNKKGKKRLL